MPARKPLGAYRRTTGDWFQHFRYNATGLINTTAAVRTSLGLFNSDEQGRICHILGVNISNFCPTGGEPQAFVSGDYYSNIGAPISGTDTAELFNTKPFFDLDGVPSVVIQAGYSDPALDDVSRLIPLDFNSYAELGHQIDPFLNAGTSFYPEGGLAAFRPGRGFCLYWFPAPGPIWAVTFDFVLLPD